MVRKLTAPAVALACLAFAFGGCGSSDDDPGTPVVCKGGSADYLAALKTAPGDVRLEGDVPISECLTENQSGGDLADVGQQMIQAATELNAAARQDPTGAEAVQLGYLVGAVERGQDAIHADLVRRLNTAARYSPDGLLPPEFERTFGQGYAAGKSAG